jgi:cytidylate kinase
MGERVVVTISRQLGSGGAYLGQRVAARLGLSYLDRVILRQAAEELHEQEGYLAAREERLTSFWEKMLRQFAAGIPEAGYVPPPLSVAPDEELFATEAGIIRKAAASGGVVIVGRCGFHVLRDVPGTVHVFLHADAEFRCRRVMELYGVGDEAVARRMIADSDRERRRFVEAMTGVDWSDARNYHLAVDTGFSGLAVAEELIVRLATEVP